MADLKYSLTLDEDEIVALIQLINTRIVQLAEENPNSVVVTFETALKNKLLEIRAAGLAAARAAGTLK